MNDIEKRARELFSIELRKEEQHEYAYHVGYGGDVGDEDQAAIRALIAALTPPQGFVLVPVDLLQVVAGCAYPVSTEIDPRGYAWSEAYLDQALPIIKAVLDASRPGVKP